MEQLKYDQQSQKKSQIKEMSNLMDIYELIDISSSSEEEGEITRSSTPLPKNNEKYPKIIVEILNSSAEATADEEEFLDLSLNSLETECKSSVNLTRVLKQLNRDNTLSQKAKRKLRTRQKALTPRWTQTCL